MIRKMDKLGRIVIPREYRYLLNIHQLDNLDISVDENKIIIQKPDNFIECSFCGYNVEEQDKYCRYCGSKLGE